MSLILGKAGKAKTGGENTLKGVWGGQCLINVDNYLKAACKGNTARLFSVLPSDRTRGNKHRLKHRKSCLNIRKHFFTGKVTEPWHRLPREVAESPSLKILKSHLDMVIIAG